MGRIRNGAKARGPGWAGHLAGWIEHGEDARRSHTTKGWVGNPGWEPPLEEAPVCLTEMEKEIWIGRPEMGYVEDVYLE
jgi:hypothetical protein